MMKLTGIYSEGTFKNNEDRLGGWVYVTRFSVNKRNVVHYFVLASKHQHFLAEEEEEQDQITLLPFPRRTWNSKLDCYKRSGPD